MQNSKIKQNTIIDSRIESVEDQELDYLANILVEAYIINKMKENPVITNPRESMEIKKLVRNIIK